MENPVLSRRDVEEFTPPGSPRTYKIAPLTVRERMAARAEVVAEGGTYPSQADLYEAMRQVLREAETEGLDDLLATLDAAEAMPADETGAEADELRQKVRRIETACQAAPAYTALLARRARHMGAIPFVYFRRAVRGWEGPDLPAFARKAGVVSDEAMEGVPEDEITLVGWRAFAMTRPSKDAEKNSEEPSVYSGTQTSGTEG
ncbi:hypothetical protein [Roseomonas chloroacetimidivorans]|uniref:hypothetical protein n=1 Tax=Roseomonas chloroacetimidivorans TaxID=1766656 RepID=UPI003C77A9E8